MHCGRLEYSANPSSRTAFHQMQYDSNYHIQVVCQRSDIVDNDTGLLQLFINVHRMTCPSQAEANYT